MATVMQGLQKPKQSKKCTIMKSHSKLKIVQKCCSKSSEYAKMKIQFKQARTSQNARTKTCSQTVENIQSVIEG